MRDEKGRRERRRRIARISGGGIHRRKRERQKGETVSGNGVGRRGGLHVISLKVPIKVAHSNCRGKQRDERHVTCPSRAIAK